MLFIYMFEQNPQFEGRVRSIYDSHQSRGDMLFTSYLALGEVLAGTYKVDSSRADEVKAMFLQSKFGLLPLGLNCVDPFGELRSQNISIADSLHLATASATGMDLFLTADKKLLKLRVPGIQFIVDLDTNLF